MWAIVLDTDRHQVEIGVNGSPAGIYFNQDLTNPNLYTLNMRIPSGVPASALLLELLVDGEYGWPAMIVEP